MLRSSTTITTSTRPTSNPPATAEPMVVWIGSSTRNISTTSTSVGNWQPKNPPPSHHAHIRSRKVKLIRRAWSKENMDETALGLSAVWIEMRRKGKITPKLAGSSKRVRTFFEDLDITSYPIASFSMICRIGSKTAPPNGLIDLRSHFLSTHHFLIKAYLLH